MTDLAPAALVRSGCPPIFHFGSQQLQDAVLPDIIAGNKRVCLAITEAEAGSDVKVSPFVEFSPRSANPTRLNPLPPLFSAVLAELVV